MTEAGGGCAERVRKILHIHSAPRNFIPLPRMKPRRTAKLAEESPENIVARLAKKLPEGYEIVNMADAIDFSSLTDS